jgi:ribonucleoside-diphosphate reductase alpha chain
MARPRILKGLTVMQETGLGKLYLTINEMDGKPVEIFAVVGKSGRSTQAKTEAIGRLVSLLLRNGVSVDRIVEQLEGIIGEHPLPSKDGVVQSVPDAVAKLLREFCLNRGVRNSGK